MSCLSCRHCLWIDNIKQQRCGPYPDYNLVSLGFKECSAYEREPGADEPTDTIESEIIAITEGADMKGVEIDIVELFNRGKLDG